MQGIVAARAGILAAHHRRLLVVDPVDGTVRREHDMTTNPVALLSSQASDFIAARSWRESGHGRGALTRVDLADTPTVRWEQSFACIGDIALISEVACDERRVFAGVLNTDAGDVLVAFEQQSGARLWQTTVTGSMGYYGWYPAVAARRVVIRVADGAAGGVLAVDTESGAIAWRERGFTGHHVTSQRVFAYRQSAGGAEHLDAIEERALGDGSLLYSTPLGPLSRRLKRSGIATPPLALGGHFLVGDDGGTLWMVDRVSGEVAWSASPPDAGSFAFSQPVVTRDRLYINSFAMGSPSYLYCFEQDSGPGLRSQGGAKRRASH